MPPRDFAVSAKSLRGQLLIGWGAVKGLSWNIFTFLHVCIAEFRPLFAWAKIRTGKISPKWKLPHSTKQNFSGNESEEERLRRAALEMKICIYFKSVMVTDILGKLISSAVKNKIFTRFQSNYSNTLVRITNKLVLTARPIDSTLWFTVIALSTSVARAV